MPGFNLNDMGSNLKSHQEYVFALCQTGPSIQSLENTSDLLFVTVQEMAAMEVAQLMHQLFTKFDSAVTESGLYKV